MKIKNILILLITLTTAVSSFDAIAYPIVFTKNVYVTNNGPSIRWHYKNSTFTCNATPWSGVALINSAKINIATIRCTDSAEGQFDFVSDGKSIGNVEVGNAPCKVLSAAPDYHVSVSSGDSACKIYIQKS